MKIIFSRKGMDSSFGSCPSAILPDGSLCWLPIPENTPSKPGLPRYEDVQFQGINLGSMIEDLSKGKISSRDTTHLDPDLCRGHRSRHQDWKPIFGQAGAAESHLRRLEVGSGDIFLFFAWFREVRNVAGKWAYVDKAPNLHVLYGWLQIENRIELPQPGSLDFGGGIAIPEWAQDHPHLIGLPYNDLDVVYTSADVLTLSDRRSGSSKAYDLPGAGLFPTFQPSLRLTEPGKSRSNWVLPEWFFPNGRTPLSYHEKMERWESAPPIARLRAASRGQEFILNADEYPETTAWLDQIFKSALTSDAT